MMKAFNPEQKCCVCGVLYKPFALESYEAQITNAEHMCKDCLQLMVDEAYGGEDD